MPKRFGHGPFRSALGFDWPLLPVRRLLYDPRPDLIKSKTRAAEWKLLSSRWRHFQALFCYLGPPSHILHNIFWPYVLILAISGGAVAWQAQASQGRWGDIDPEGKLRESFRLTSFIMSLLLAFRLNRTYERWNLARASMAGVGNGATSVFLQAATWISDKDLVDDLRRFCIIWPFAIKMVVEGSKKLDPVADALLFPEEQKVFYGSRKGRQVVVTKVRAIIAKSRLPEEQFAAMEAAVTQTWRAAGDALRVKFQAMPEGVTLVCTGFVMIWCCLLPFGLSSEGLSVDWPTLMVMAVIALLLLSVDELATQMEDPFHLMPLNDIAATYERDINRVLRELPEIEAATDAGRERIRKELLAQAAAGGGKCEKGDSGDVLESVGIKLEGRRAPSQAEAPELRIAAA